MSFGFLTESALLPSKSKPIKVDGRSLVDLKAIVYAKEQKVKQEGSGTEAGGLRVLRGKRAAAGGEGAAAAASVRRKDVFARSNRGVEDRLQRDELERVTQSKKKKTAERTLAVKAKLYEKMARGEVVESHAGSLVDFSRKTGADLALLEAKTPSSSELSASKRRRKAVKSHSRGRKRRGDDDDDNDDEANGSYVDESLSEPDDDPTSAEVNITDEFGRERTVLRGGAQHRAFLAAKKAKAEEKAEEKAKAEAYDERYSYRGNRGSTPLIPGVSTASGAIGDSGRPGEWTWGSGHGRGADCGDFETRKGEERRAAKGMAKLLQAEKSYASGGGGGGGRNGVDGEERGGKILSQWEKTLTGDQKAYLQEVHEEAEAGRSTKAEKASGRRQRQDRKQLLRQKQEDRAKAALL